MTDIRKAIRERQQVRRIFSRTSASLEIKLVEDEGDFNGIEVDFLYLEDKLSRLRALDEVIQNIYITSEEYQEELYSKEVDDSEKYVNLFFTCKQKYLQLKQKLSTKETTTYTTVKEEKRNFKLPQIEIKKFDDDPKKWIQFWGQFRKIHEDRKINEEDKFQYLLQCLKEDSNARALVESFPPSAENYEKAVAQLKNRFGREEMLVEVYIRELLGMVLSQARGEVVLDLRSLYDKISTYLHALETLKVTKDRYDAMLFPFIESAMPESILMAWSRAQLHNRGEGSKRLAQLLQFLNNEVEAEERIRLARFEFNTSQSQSRSSHSHGPDVHPTAACLTTKVTTEKGKESCYFCDRDNHTVNECDKAGDLNLEEKKELIKKKGGCYVCLKRGHMAKQCKVFLKCLVCKRRHLVVLCPELHNTKKDYKEVSKKPNENVTFCQDKITTPLQTLVAVIENGDKKKKVRILLDGGSQRTYIRSSLAEELGLKAVGQEEFGHTLFGGMKTKPEVYNKFSFIVSSLDNSFDMKIEALAMKNALCGYLPKVENKRIMQKLHQSNIQITDLDFDIIDIGILIGSDHLGSILTGTLINIEDNLCAMKTRLGWTLQGPTTSTYSSTLQHTCFSGINIITDLRNLGIRDTQEKREEEEILKHFNDNISEAESYYLKIPLWKNTDLYEDVVTYRHKRVDKSPENYKETVQKLQCSVNLKHEVKDKFTKRDRMSITQGNKIESTTSSQAILRKCIPTRSPWWGGWWEHIIHKVTTATTEKVRVCQKRYRSYRRSRYKDTSQVFDLELVVVS